jgi:hypothetical protein
MPLSKKQRLNDFFTHSTSQRVLLQEKSMIDGALGNLFGYFALQFGVLNYPQGKNLLEQNRVSFKVCIDDEVSIHEQYRPHSKRSFCNASENESLVQVHNVIADFNFLPIAADQVDVALLPHTLEYCDDPHYLLRQVDLMLVGEGYMVITGFNPIGCFSLFNRTFKAKSELKGLNVKHASKLKEWLEVLGYQVQSVQYSQAMCFASNKEVSWWVRFVEKIERFLERFGLHFGNTYCLVAKKKVDAPTLVGLKWHLPAWKGKRSSIAQPFSSESSQLLNRSKNIKESNASR